MAGKTPDVDVLLDGVPTTRGIGTTCHSVGKPPRSTWRTAWTSGSGTLPARGP